MNSDTILVFRLLGIYVSMLLVIDAIDSHPTIPTRNGVIFIVTSVVVIGGLYLIFLQREDTP